MRIGVPREIKDNEYRVGLTPSSVAELVQHGHAVLVEKGAGLGAGFGDAAYESIGASLVEGAGGVFESADLIVKVKEPLAPERRMLRRGQTTLHLSASRPRSRAHARAAAERRNLHRL